MKKKTKEKSEFAKRLINARREKNLTQEKFAEKLCMDAKAYGKYECDETTPSLDRLKDICELLDVSADYLLFGKENSADVQIATLLSACPVDKQKYAIDCIKAFVLSHVEK